MDGAVGVWWCPLDVDEACWRALTDVLAEEEREEGEQRREATDRRRFLAARGWRRHLLARELQAAPGELRISTRPGGKPFLADSRLAFSAARSGELCMIVCSWEMEVGADLEAIDPRTDVARFARRFFTAAEQQALAALPVDERRGALFECWTRKEAYLKGTGEGLDVPTDSIEVWAGDGRPVAVGGWRVHRVTVAPGFAAAVAGADAGAWVPSVSRQES
jgi:4'-phosphopantetheinyl transferase